MAVTRFENKHRIVARLFLFLKTTKMKKSLLVLLLMLTCCAQSIWAADVFYATTIEEISLKFSVINEDQKTCMLHMLQDPSIEGVVTIPSVANGYTVTQVDQIAFAVCDKITKVIIPNTVTYIGQGAFSGCKSLKEVVIPHSVDRLENNLFNECESLESFVLPSSVTYMKGGSFAGCKSLVSLSVEEGNPVYESPSNSNAIITKAGYLACGCQTTVIPEGVTIIGEDAFLGCPFESFEIPSGIEEIRSGAFSYCPNLTSITIPASVNDIGLFHGDHTGDVFRCCDALTTVISYIEEPFEIEESNFQLYDSNTHNYYFTTATLYVPVGSKERYMATSCWNKFQTIEVIGGDPIDLNPIDGDTTINMPTEDDVEDTVIDNVYYNLEGNNGYDSSEGCIIINTTTDITSVDGEPGSETIKDNFTGLIFQVNGKGVIELDCQTLGLNALNVKVGTNVPTTISKDERGIVEVAYDVAEPTYVYIYATSAGASAPSLVSASENCVKLWSLTVKPGATLGISPIDNRQLTIEKYYTLDGRKVVNPTAKGVYIYNCNKVVIK